MNMRIDRTARRARATWLLGLARAMGAQLSPHVMACEEELWRDRRLAPEALAELEAGLVDEDLPTFTTLDAVVNSAIVALYYADMPIAGGSDDQVEEVIDLLIQARHDTTYRDPTALTHDVLLDIAHASRAALDASAQSWGEVLLSLPAK